MLPSAPAAFGAQVVVSPALVGEDARAYAAREKAGRLEANARLGADATFYADVVERFGEPTGAPAATSHSHGSVP